MEIVFLGTGAGMSVTRAHTAIAVRCGDGTLLLLDGSSGNSALRHGLLAGIRAADYDCALLSHDHQDHISGLMFVQGRRSHETAEETPLPVYGSLLGLAGLRKAAVAARIPEIRGSSPGEGKAFNHSGREVLRWREAPAGRPLELGPDTVAWPFEVEHIPGSIGWRIESGGRAVVFSGDTTYSPGLVAAAQGGGFADSRGVGYRCGARFGGEPAAFYVRGCRPGGGPGGGWAADTDPSGQRLSRKPGAAAGGCRPALRRAGRGGL